MQKTIADSLKVVLTVLNHEGTRAQLNLPDATMFSQAGANLIRFVQDLESGRVSLSEVSDEPPATDSPEGVPLGGLESD